MMGKLFLQESLEISSISLFFWSIEFLIMRKKKSRVRVFSSLSLSFARRENDGRLREEEK